MGGCALSGSPINKKDIIHTLLEYQKQVLSNIIYRGIDILGSAGKKSVSSDIDLAIETNLTVEGISQILNNIGIKNKFNKGLNQVYTLFPIYTEAGKSNKSVQIDIIPGNIKWLRFAYWAPEESMTKYTAHHRSILLAAIIRYCRGIDAKKTLVINWTNGIFEKTRESYIGRNGQEKEKIIDKQFVTNNPQQLVEILSKETNHNWCLEDLLQPIEILWEKAIQVFDSNTINAIKKYCIPAIEHRGINYIVPDFLR